MATETPSSMFCYDEEIHPKTNKEPSWNKTSVFLMNDQQNFPEPLLAHEYLRKRMYGTTSRFEEEDAADGTSFAPFDQGRSTHQFPSYKLHRYIKYEYKNAPKRPKEEDLTTKLSPLSLRPVSFKYEKINGHTPMMLATTSTRLGLTKSLVRMAFFRVAREDIQSRVSAPFSRLTMKSVLASPSKLSKTLEAVRCKHHLNRRRSKNG